MTVYIQVHHEEEEEDANLRCCLLAGLRFIERLQTKTRHVNKHFSGAGPEVHLYYFLWLGGGQQKPIK